MAVEGNGKVYQWAVRGPGMPQKIMRSDKELNEDQIKKLYLSTVKFLEANIHRKDSEVPWKIIPMTDSDIQKANLGFCLKETRRKNHQGLIEVVNGKIIGGTFVDGKFIPDVKPKAVVPKTRTKVDVSISQPKK